MKVSYDLRFAHLPGGSWFYVSELIRWMVQEHWETAWRIYHNTFSPPQQRIVEQLRGVLSGLESSGHVGDEISGNTNRKERAGSTTHTGTTGEKHHPRAPVEFRAVKYPTLTLRQHLESLSWRDDADVYHYLHFDMPLGLRGPRLVFTIHDVYPLVLPDYCDRARRWYFRAVCQRNLDRARRVITISQRTRQDLLERLRVAEDKVVVIPQGYSPAFRPLGREEGEREHLAAVRREYHLPDRFILYCGNHKPHKNLSRLLQAYAQLPAALREAFGLVLTGPITAETDRLRVLAGQLGIGSRVQFLGMVPAEILPVLFNLAAVLVQPSLYEGFGLPPLEAMACGTPVVTARAGALPEVVGRAGRLFDPRDIDDMAETLAAALERDVGNPQSRDRCLARARQFGWDKTARRTYAVYEQVAAE